MNCSKRGGSHDLTGERDGSIAVASVRRRRGRICGIARVRSPLIPHGVLLVDDQPEFLQAAELVLAAHSDLTVVATATDAEEALDLVVALAPDLVVLDVQMPGTNGFETARRMIQASPGLRVVMVSSDGERDYEGYARSAGAEGFLTKKQLLASGLSSFLGE